MHPAVAIAVAAVAAVAATLGATPTRAAPPPAPAGPRPREPEFRTAPEAAREAPASPAPASHHPVARPVAHLSSCTPAVMDGADARRIARRLDALADDAGRDPVLWLEAWTEADTAPVGTSPTLWLRASHGGWVTVFWRGPDGTLVTPARGVWLASGRDVRLPLDATLVTPAGREQLWAILVPETAEAPCGSAAGLAAWLSARERGLVAVARAGLASTLVSAGQPLPVRP